MPSSTASGERMLRWTIVGIAGSKLDAVERHDFVSGDGKWSCWNDNGILPAKVASSSRK